MHRHAPDVSAARLAHRVARDRRQERPLLGAGGLIHPDVCREFCCTWDQTGQGVEMVSRVRIRRAKEWKW